MSARSKKRRHAQRKRMRSTLELIRRTGVAYVSPDLLPLIGKLARDLDGVEIQVEAYLPPRTIAGFDFERFAWPPVFPPYVPVLDRPVAIDELLGPLPSFGAILGPPFDRPWR